MVKKMVKYCTNCGQSNGDNVNFCTNCGGILDNNTEDFIYQNNKDIVENPPTQKTEEDTIDRTAEKLFIMIGAVINLLLAGLFLAGALFLGLGSLSLGNSLFAGLSAILGLGPVISIIICFIVIYIGLIMQENPQLYGAILVILAVLLPVTTIITVVGSIFIFLAGMLLLIRK